GISREETSPLEGFDIKRKIYKSRFGFKRGDSSQNLLALLYRYTIKKTCSFSFIWKVSCGGTIKKLVPRENGKPGLKPTFIIFNNIFLNYSE
ncbi:MAG: hypothetical protein ACPGSL_05185, partial [Vicingaceae bacterium]